MITVKIFVILPVELTSRISELRFIARWIEKQTLSEIRYVWSYFIYHYIHLSQTYSGTMI